jgi:D-glycero-D-manno-heptose 1,7-bisphosphate phosphatase
MARNRALLLDRDGVINVERGYVHIRDDFEFQPGIFELCRAARDLGYLIVVVTNQAGIARGYYTEAAFLELTAWMVDRFAEQGIEVARVYHCPYHPVHGLGAYRYDSPDRKPKPGMILKARAELDLDLAASVLVGDKASDVQAGVAAGIGANILLGPDASNGTVALDCHRAESLGDVQQRFFTRAQPSCVGES